MSEGKITAIVLAAGRGTRMGSRVQKQYMMLQGKPLIYYALSAFEQSSVDQVVLVTGAGEIGYCRQEIAERFGFSKPLKVIEGGKERYHSVYAGLKAAEDSSIVLIHDGARPLVTVSIIEAAISGAREFGACVAAVPVKDTIKLGDDCGYAKETLDRSHLWMIQTPQAFSYELLTEGYHKLFEAPENQIGVTDDAMVIETMTDRKVRLIPGSYTNIKVTTPDDMAVAEILLKKVLNVVDRYSY